MKPPADAPTWMVVPATGQTIFTSAVFLVCGVVLVVVVRGPAARRDWAELRFRLLVLLGGTLSVFFFEGAVDLAGKCWYAIPGGWSVIDLLGNHVQLWVVGAYFGFEGGFAVLVIDRVRRGAPPATFVKLAGAIVLADLLLEVPLLRIGKLYAYYGANQPLFNHSWFPLPGWMLATNAVFPIVPALLVLALMSTRKRHIEWAIPFVMVGSCYITYGAIGWPVMLAVHSGLSKLDTTIAALVTIGLGCGSVALLSQLAPKLAGAMNWYGMGTPDARGIAVPDRPRASSRVLSRVGAS